MIRARERIDDKDWLDLHLSPSRWSRRMGPDEVVQNYLRVLQEASAEARAKAPAKLLDVEYAPGLAIDFLAASEAQLAPGAATPIVVYVHGGYWQFMGKDESSFLAAEIVAAGYTHAAVDYTLCPGGVCPIRSHATCLRAHFEPHSDAGRASRASALGRSLHPRTLPYRAASSDRPLGRRALVRHGPSGGPFREPCAATAAYVRAPLFAVHGRLLSRLQTRAW